MTKRMKPEERKALLLEQARALFVANGFEQVRVDDILDASGISKGGFYHHFESKDDVLRLLVDMEATQLASLINASASMDPIESLIGLLEAGSTFLDGTHGIGATLGTFGAKALYLNAMETSFERHLKPALVALIDRGVTDGTFSPVDPETTAEVFMAINNHANRKSVLQDWPEENLLTFSSTGVRLLGVHLGIEDALTKLHNRLLQKK